MITASEARKLKEEGYSDTESMIRFRATSGNNSMAKLMSSDEAAILETLGYSVTNMGGTYYVVEWY